MARYRRRRFYRRKRIWSSRIQNISLIQQVASGQTFFGFRNLAVNPLQSDDTISQRFTVKNISIQFTVESAAPPSTTVNSFENLQAYILFIPQGFTLTDSTPYEHPEWIMASKFIGVPVSYNNPGYAPLSIRTRLARKLDTGDKLVFVVIGENNGAAEQSARLTGVVRYWTKAN